MVGTPSASAAELNAGLPTSQDDDVEQLRAALDQAAARLREVDHRVKNNLQLIASLLLLQSRRVRSMEVRAALGSALERVNAVAAVHRWLFENDGDDGLDLSAFVGELAEDVLGGLTRQDVQISLAADPVRISPVSAAPLALIISELVLNAVAHAFPPERGGLIRLVIHRFDDGLRIEIADDGVGMPASTSRDQEGLEGMGLQIVDLLSQQLHARIERRSGGPGVHTILHLPPDITL
jgi:two-component sensor histidine kinase